MHSEPQRVPVAILGAGLTGLSAAIELEDRGLPYRNFEKLCLVHFGAGISRHFMIPYNSRLWGVHPREITSSWCQRFVPLPRLEDVLAGAVGLNDRELGYNTHFIYPRLGIGELAQGMARRVPGLELARSPRRIELARRRLIFDDETVDFDV